MGQKIWAKTKELLQKISLNGLKKSQNLSFFIVNLIILILLLFSLTFTLALAGKPAFRSLPLVSSLASLLTPSEEIITEPGKISYETEKERQLDLPSALLGLLKGGTLPTSLTPQPTRPPSPYTYSPTTQIQPTPTPTPFTDNIPPTVVIQGGPTNGSTVDFANFCFPLYLTDNVSSWPNIWYSYQFDNSGWSAWINTDASPCFNNVSNSQHTFKVKAKDQAGNISGEQIRNFTVNVPQLTPTPLPVDSETLEYEPVRIVFETRWIKPGNRTQTKVTWQNKRSEKTHYALGIALENQDWPEVNPQLNYSIEGPMTIKEVICEGRWMCHVHIEGDLNPSEQQTINFSVLSRSDASSGTFRSYSTGTVWAGDDIGTFHDQRIL